MEATRTDASIVYELLLKAFSTRISHDKRLTGYGPQYVMVPSEILPLLKTWDVRYSAMQDA